MGEITQATASPIAASVSATVVPGAIVPKAPVLPTAKVLKPPSSLSLFNTNDLAEGYFHACIYGETSTRKSVTAARFASKDDVRIVLTRRKEQLIPLRNEGYQVALAEDASALNFALLYPEQLWGEEWAKRPNRTLILDDATEAVNMLLDENTSIDGHEVKDRRRTYKAAGEDLRAMLKVVLRRPQHFIMTALARTKDNAVTEEESVQPDLPPSMFSMLGTEMEFCFFINVKTWMFTTDRDFFTYVSEDPENPARTKTYRRAIFAKHKLPMSLVGKGTLQKTEKMDLADIWRRVKGGGANAVKV